MQWQEKFSIDSAAVNKRMALASKAGISFSLIIAARALLPPYLRLDNTKNSSLVTATQGRCTVAENFTVHKIVYPPRKTSMQLLS